MNATKVVIGTKVYCGLYGGSYGIVVAIRGEQAPETIRDFSGIGVVSGGRAEFDVVFEDGNRNDRLPEAIVRGVQWEIYDEVATADDVLDAVLLADKTAKERAAAEKVSAEKHAVDYARYVELLTNTYPNATPADKVVRGHRISSQARAAANIRSELTMAFPGVKFSVKSDCFAGGDAVDVTWDMGPTRQEVAAITDKYAYRHFDGMDDSYHYNRSAFDGAVGKVLGQAKYVTAHRGVPDESRELVGRALCAAQQVEYIGQNTRNVYGQGDCQWLSDHVGKIFSETSLPAGAVVTGLTHKEWPYSGEPYGLAFTVPVVEQPTVKAAGYDRSAAAKRAWVTIRAKRAAAGV